MTKKQTSRTTPQATCAVTRDGGVVRVALAGDWRMGATIPDVQAVATALQGAAKPSGVAFESSGVSGWDSRLLAFCLRIMRLAEAAGVTVDTSGLPEGAGSLVDLAVKVPERKGAARKDASESFLEEVGGVVLGMGQAVGNLLEFLGEVTLACGNFLRGRAVFQRSQLVLLIRQAGLDALPIVSLISLLVGLILAFVGAIQLQQFGAQIYVSTIVGIAMVRVMGAIMTGIIMAGRTGAAYAAELGTMQVNEEIDALRTFGFSPTEFLVLPRLIALVTMMPLLCIYADLMGVLGGFIVGSLMLGINPVQYFTNTWQSVPLANFWIGLVHSTVFGVLVALAGCYRGMRCGRSALAVGQAATSAVVTSILAIIIATAIITVVCNILGI
ncbi:abc-type transport system [hydrocarbon metagenome]|uniref:Abc-type transport system n=1 Tax=hydrocarbon metagenome TaxID=938273 RepID=A0A0W8GAE8_9ZZZZ